MKRITLSILCFMLIVLSIKAQGTATLSFDDRAKRTFLDTSQQVWEENGVTLTNKQSISSHDIADYAKPVRLYKSSIVVIEFISPMTNIEFVCNNAAYATRLNQSIPGSVLNDNIVTVKLDGTSDTYTCLMTVGQVRLDAITITYTDSEAAVTPENPEEWNNISLPHRVTFKGIYNSSSNTKGVIEYSVENSNMWYVLTDALAPGTEVETSLIAKFDKNNPTHIIKFRSRDFNDNTTLLPSIEYVDVSFHQLTNISDKTYTGDSLYMSDLICDLDNSQYTITNYRNNVNAGTASFEMQGVFPNTIGSKTYTFTINPQPLEGELQLGETSSVYNGTPFTPAWQFTNENYANLENEKDYTIQWSNNILPGTGALTITGRNNYTGTLYTYFNIDKAVLTDDLFTVTLPNEDITYDEQCHGATITKADGVGEATILYQEINSSVISETEPSEAGEYNIYLEFAEGTLYYGRERSQIGSFSIYQFNATEWAILQAVLPQLTAMGWSQPWDISQGMKGVSSLQGLTIEKGHITALNLNGQNLTGMFPYAVLAFPKLQSINLGGNNLSGDIGLPTYAFAQQNPNMMLALQELNISGNSFTGNLGIFANCFSNLKTLDASSNCLEDVYPMIPSTVTSLDISRQNISRVVPLHLANLSVDSIATKVPSILLYDHTYQTFTPNINMLCTTQDNSWGMMLSYQNGEITIPYISEQNVYYGESGDILNVAVVDSYGTPKGSYFQISLDFYDGDSNFDGEVNVLDLQSNILFIIEKYFIRPFNFTAANMWEDNIINIQDIICFVNKLIETENAETPQAAKARINIPNTESDSEATICIQNGQLVFETEEPIAAFDITVNGASNLNIANNIHESGMTISAKAQSNGLRIIGYSLNGGTIPVGTSVVGQTDNNASIGSAMLADSEAKAIKVSLNGSTTGIVPTQAELNKDGDIYDIQGRKTNSTANKGIYIINGHKVMK